uniref:Ig-like domain-containing protein n=1 Tax=Macrostomum lignano TaxID=282301 RepID=A0A1I8GY70_9PLAT
RPSNSRGNDLPPLDDEFSSKKSSGKKKKHLPPLKPAVRRVDETLSDDIVAVNENDVFNFDFTWRPLRPMANETVHFRAIGTGQSVMQQRNGQPQPESDYQPTSWSRVDIVKYIGLQRRIHSALIVKNRTTEHGRGRRIVESLEFRPPTSPHSPAVCRTMSGHFETIETEPYIDLVSDCSTDTLPAGEYSCYGRNSVGEGRLKCRLDEGQGEFLGNMTQCWDTLAEDSSVESSRKVYRQIVANNGINKPESVAMATAFGLSCLETPELRKTNDGSHECGLCRNIAAAR